jgi:transcriptional regulator
MDELTIPQEEALAILSESKHSNIKFPMYTAVIFRVQVKVTGFREKGLSQPHFSKMLVKDSEASILCLMRSVHWPKINE